MTMDFSELMERFRNKEFAFVFDCIDDVEEFTQIAHIHASADYTTIFLMDSKKESSFSEYVVSAYELGNHIFFIGSLDFLGSVEDMSKYYFNYPLWHWQDIRKYIYDLCEPNITGIDSTEYFQILCS